MPYTSPNEIFSKRKNQKLLASDLILDIFLKHITSSSLAILTAAWASYKLPTRLLLNQVETSRNYCISRTRQKLPQTATATGQLVVEKIISTRLTNFLKENNIQPNIQFGLCQHRSTTHQLLRITKIVIVGLKKK